MMKMHTNLFRVSFMYKNIFNASQKGNEKKKKILYKFLLAKQNEQVPCITTLAIM